MKMRELKKEAVVVGSGAAGLSAAIRLWEGGIRDIAVVTEDLRAGTSRNTGSDKQTYYKLSLAAGERDSVLDMAEDLFAGQCVDGDIALCEAALSSRCFFRLLELGVPFPDTEYGEFMGYKTDHDRGRRATSAGPYTSRLMTESLEKCVFEQGIPVLDGLQMIKIMVSDGRVRGLLCLDARAAEEEYVLIWCDDLILASGGPAGMYRDSVYPVSQLGASGAAFEAGASGKNLTEWQFGLASLEPRWNVSGSYMQVLPRFVSTDEEGKDEREFLGEFFKDPGEMNSAVFLKGYQWPFDAAKVMGGSSLIDLLVYRETVMRGRRVFLDFTKDPGGGVDYASLSPEARNYLTQAGVCFGTPIERLEAMNKPAVSFYLDRGVDLRKEKLRIAVCAQHNNGGLAADADWETGVKGLFAVGEVCGSHGVTRPGGSALNAGQAGAFRAARRVRLRKLREGTGAVCSAEETALRKEAENFARLPHKAVGDTPAAALWKEASARMSASGGMIRSREGLEKALKETEELLEGFSERVKKPSPGELPLFYRLRDVLISQRIYLAAMLDYLEKGGGSRGSALYTDPEGELFDPSLPEIFRLRLDAGRHGGVIQEAALKGNSCEISWRPVRPIPAEDYFFENRWKEYREREGL